MSEAFTHALVVSLTVGSCLVVVLLLYGAWRFFRSERGWLRFGLGPAVVGLLLLFVVLHPFTQLGALDRHSASLVKAEVARLQQAGYVGRDKDWVKRQLGPPAAILSDTYGREYWEYSATPWWIWAQWDYVGIQFEEATVDDIYVVVH